MIQYETLWTKSLEQVAQVRPLSSGWRNHAWTLGIFCSLRHIFSTRPFWTCAWSSGILKNSDGTSQFHRYFTYIYLLNLLPFHSNMRFPQGNSYNTIFHHVPRGFFIVGIPSDFSAFLDGDYMWHIMIYPPIFGAYFIQLSLDWKSSFSNCDISRLNSLG